MNTEQLKSVALILLGSVGTYFVNKGWITNEQWVAGVGAAVTLVSLAWAIYRGSQSVMIVNTAALPKVDEIKTNDLKIANSAPDNVTPSVNAR